MPITSRCVSVFIPARFGPCLKRIVLRRSARASSRYRMSMNASHCIDVAILDAEMASQASSFHTRRTCGSNRPFRDDQGQAEERAGLNPVGRDDDWPRPSSRVSGPDGYRKDPRRVSRIGCIETEPAGLPLQVSISPRHRINSDGALK
jgi:hypothetical protein